MNDDDIQIPSGGFCYRVVPIAKGEVLSKDLDRFGKDLREYSYHGDRKEVLCPYWVKTDHGTIRCERLNVEVLSESEDYEVALAKAAQHFGLDNVDSKVGRSYWLADEIKICDINIEDEEDG